MRNPRVLLFAGFVFLFLRILWTMNDFSQLQAMNKEAQLSVAQREQLYREDGQREKVEQQIFWKECDPCDNNWVFIISNGNTKQNTLLSIMETLPGAEMSNEGDGAFNVIYKLPFFPGAPSFGEAFIPGQPNDGAFEHGVVELDSICCGIQEYFNTISDFSADVRMKVFKTTEILDSKYIFLLKQIFPCGKFILEINTKSQKKSPELEKRNRKFKRFSRIFPEQSFIFPLESKSVSFKNHYQLLIEWLGFKDCEVNLLDDSLLDQSPIVDGSCVLDDFSSTIPDKRSNFPKYWTSRTFSQEKNQMSSKNGT